MATSMAALAIATLILNSQTNAKGDSAADRDNIRRQRDDAHHLGDGGPLSFCPDVS